MKNRLLHTEQKAQKAYTTPLGIENTKQLST